MRKGEREGVRRLREGEGEGCKGVRVVVKCLGVAG